MKSQILSVRIISQWPKSIRLFVNLKLTECEHLLLKVVSKLFQNIFVFVHSQNMCKIVSLFRLQKEQRSVWLCVYFETDLFVVRMWCKILDWIHLSLGSFVVAISLTKESSHSSLEIPVFCDHFLNPLMFASGIINLL